MKLAENFTFFELLLVGIDGVSDAAWVPVDGFEFGHFFWFMMFFEFCLDFFLCKLIKLDNLSDELLIVELFAKTPVVGVGWIDSKDYR